MTVPVVKTCTLCLREFSYYPASRGPERIYDSADCSQRAGELRKQGREPVDPGYVCRGRIGRSVTMRNHIANLRSIRNRLERDNRWDEAHEIQDAIDALARAVKLAEAKEAA